MDYAASMQMDLSEEEWFASLKQLALRHGFSDNVKEWKKNKAAFKGHIGDVSEFLRIALSGRKNAPNLYYIIQILGEQKVKQRIKQVVSTL